MSKKKSYMDKKNILSEGFVTTFLKDFLKFYIPIKGISMLLKNRKINKIQKQIDKLQKEKEKNETTQKSLLNSILKQVEKDTGVKISDASAKKSFDDYQGD